MAGSAALFSDYQACLSRLEGVINGELQAKKAALAEAADAVERNMGQLRQAAEAVHAEIDEEYDGIRERLGLEEKRRMTLLRHDLSSYAAELDAIDDFVRQALSLTRELTPGESAAEQALVLVRREPELMANVNRMLQRPVSAPLCVSTDDLPREVAQARSKLERLHALEGLLAVKDSVIAALVDEAGARDKSVAEQCSYANRAHAAASSMQLRSHDELTQWATLADQYVSQLHRSQASLAASQHEAGLLRGQNDQLRAQNQELREHCDELRTLLLRTGGGVPLGPAVVGA